MQVILPPVSEKAALLYLQLGAPPRLVRHLQVVHASALMLVDGLARCFPDLAFDRQRVLMGAAIHDLGKVLHPEEIQGPGHLHEINGPGLLEQHGLEASLAKFARTHGEWEGEGIEDLLVALADMVWKGHRHDALEQAVCRAITAQSGVSDWQAWSVIDELAEAICLKLSGWI